MTANNLRTTAAALALLALAGCESQRTEVTPGRTRITERVSEAPAGREVTERIEPPSEGGAPGARSVTTRETPPVRTVEREAEAVGPGARVLGAGGLREGFSGLPAALALPGGGSARGGGFDFNARLDGEGARSWIAFGVGALLILGGGGCVYVGLRRAATALFAVGAGFVVVGLWPAALAWAALAAVVGMAGWIVYESHQGRSWKESLRASLQAAYSLPASARATWRDAFGAAADRPSDQARADKVVREDRLEAIAASGSAMAPDRS